MGNHMMENEEDTHEYTKITPSSEGNNLTAEEAHIFPISTATILFQVLMVLASVYYSMLMTNWGNPSAMDETYEFF